MFGAEIDSFFKQFSFYFSSVQSLFHRFETLFLSLCERCFTLLHVAVPWSLHQGWYSITSIASMATLGLSMSPAETSWAEVFWHHHQRIHHHMKSTLRKSLLHEWWLLGTMTSSSCYQGTTDHKGSRIFKMWIICCTSIHVQYIAKVHTV